MSYDFFSRKTVVGRKAHICEHCHKAIAEGERHAYSAGKFEGYFVAYREHEDCLKAWKAFNEDLRDNRWDDTHPFLADDDYDVGEREWIHERFPAVAARIWPSKFGVPA